ncbi:MAG: hypothetical protein KIT09_14720 [Bryobacteraceae bacterium]|nr:hypothetical protein [Bryobacteraceae bacterium]
MPRTSMCAGVGLLLFSVVLLPAANVNRYDDQTAFEADTLSRSIMDFDTVRTACIAIPDAGGLTVNNINFSGGVSRATSSGPCSPPLTAWSGYVLVTRLVIRGDAPAQAFATVTLPAGVTAVGFHLGINSDPVASRIHVALATSDKGEQTFIVDARGTGSGGSRRVDPVFVGFTSSRPISTVRFRVPDITDSNLILDDFITGQSAPPLINATDGVVHGASFQPVLAANTWVTIFGNLLSGASRPWSADDFVGSRLPTSVEDVSVTINGQSAYVCYVSPGQVNALLPVEVQEGPGIVQVSRGELTSAPVTVQVKRAAPGFFLLDPENRRYVIATHADGSLVGKTSLYPGVSTPARPGEIVVFWGAGFGATSPAAPAGELLAAPANLVASPTLTIGGVPAETRFAGLSSTGLYQLNVVVPQELSDGDAAVMVDVDGARTQDNVFMTIQR